MRDRRLLHGLTVPATGPTAALAVRADAPAPVAAARPPRRRDFPGWRMVWVLSVTETVGYAALFYCFAVMVLPMRTDLGASTRQVSRRCRSPSASAAPRLRSSAAGWTGTAPGG